MDDKQKRDAAVDAFAAEMKKRLDDKAAQGYTGWDGEHSADDLRLQNRDDTEDMGLFGHDEKTVDVANRCMFLWYRGTDQARPAASGAIVRPSRITEEMMRFARTDDLWHFSQNLNAMLRYGYCSRCGLTPHGCASEGCRANSAGERTLSAGENHA